MRLVAAGLTRCGYQRDTNEDGVGVFSDDGVVVVCDSMGGNVGGTFVTPVVVSGFRAALRARAATSPTTHAADDVAALREVARAVDRGVRESNDAIGVMARGAGAAACALWLRGDRLVWAHVGDTMLHLLRDGALTRVWREHTLEQMWLATPEAFQAQPDEAVRWRNVLVRAFGVADASEPDCGALPLRDGDVLLASTDGVWGALDDAALERILFEAQGVDAAVRAIFDALSRTAWTDNAGAVVMRVASSAQPASHAREGGLRERAATVTAFAPARPTEAPAQEVLAESSDDAEVWERLCTRELLPPWWSEGMAQRVAGSLDMAVAKQRPSLSLRPAAAFAASLASHGRDTLDTLEVLAREVRQRLRPWGFAGSDRVVWAPLSKKPPVGALDLDGWTEVHAAQDAVRAWQSRVVIPRAFSSWSSRVARCFAGAEAWQGDVVVPPWNRAVARHPYADLASPWEPLCEVIERGFLVVEVSPDGVWIAAPVAP